MTPSFAPEASSPSQQEAEIARRLELLESRFLAPQRNQQQNHVSDSVHSKNNTNAAAPSNNQNNSVLTSNTILLVQGDGSQHSFSFEGYCSVQKENVAITSEVVGDPAKLSNKSEAYKLVEKAAQLHIQKVIDENNNNNMMGRSNGSSSIILESPTTSYPGTDDHGFLSPSSVGQGEPGTWTKSGVPNTTSTTTPTTEAIRNPAASTTNTEVIFFLSMFDYPKKKQCHVMLVGCSLLFWLYLSTSFLFIPGLPSSSCVCQHFWKGRQEVHPDETHYSFYYGWDYKTSY
jgi:hypothetical protein